MPLQASKVEACVAHAQKALAKADADLEKLKKHQSLGARVGMVRVQTQAFFWRIYQDPLSGWLMDTPYPLRSYQWKPLRVSWYKSNSSYL